MNEILVNLLGTSDINLVIFGYFWALFGLIFTIVDDKSDNRKTKLFKKMSIFEFIKYSMAIIAVMRFSSFILNIDNISFAGFIVGLSIRNLPLLIKRIAKKYTDQDAPQP